MGRFLGIDTSNYTTSAALYNSETGQVWHSKRLLPVKEGQLGLRQSEAVFHHVQQLPQVVEKLQDEIGGPIGTITAVGVSARPRDVAGSYMPCFTVGVSVARILGQTLAVPVHEFSHQAGHIVAALYSAGRLDLLNEPFLAFHVSGGTTETVLAQPSGEGLPQIKMVAQTLDLNAGQAVDRVGGMLGLPFPAGPQLEKLAAQYTGQVRSRPVLKGCNCCLSGIENICKSMLQNGEQPEKVAFACLDYIAGTLDMMCERLLQAYGNLPVLFAGGVMSNTMIRTRLQNKYHAFFAQPVFSSDNAAGIAVLAAINHQGRR
ncbi:MAG TPA: peptidase M22 [Candidatus Gallacutalibacter stercoravium]|nr:peptidase M22 [Candidatus Gallacutalibacter stercoravium]